MYIIFVKWGLKYTSDQVNSLYHSLVIYNNKSAYYCYTEDPKGLDTNIKIIPIIKKPKLKKWWNKLYLFSEDFPMTGPCVFFDIDTKINSNPFGYFTDFSKLTLIDCHWKSDSIYDRPHNYDVRINSSVITWTPGNHTNIWSKFIENRDYYLRKYKGIDRFIVHEGFDYDKFPQELIQSYKHEHNKQAPITTYEELDYGNYFKTNS